MEIDVISFLLNRDKKAKEKLATNKYTYKGSSVDIMDGVQFISFLGELRNEDIVVEGNVSTTAESAPIFSFGRVENYIRNRATYNVDIAIYCTEEQIIDFESRYNGIAKYRTINFANQYIGEWDWNRELRREVLTTVPLQEDRYEPETMDRWSRLHSQGIISTSQLRGIADIQNISGSITADSISAGSLRIDSTGNIFLNATSTEYGRHPEW
jgi:hypothetical protein